MDRRNTRQRQLVLEAVYRLRHPDAEEVYSEVAREHPHVSKATVYRNLNLLAQQGDIRKVETAECAARFDGRTETHYHFRCRLCGKIEDAPMKALDAPEKYLERTDGFTVERHELLFVGICAGCKNKISGGN